MMAGQECYNYTVFLHGFANFPQKGGAAVDGGHSGKIAGWKRCCLCSMGVGLVTQAANDNLKIGVLAGCVFPAVLVLSVLLLKRKREKV